MTYYDLNMNSKRINNTQDPASAQDVATKNYVDARPLGWVGGVVDSSTTSVTITSAPTTCLTATFTAQANRRYLITASWTMFGNTAGQVIDFDIRDGATVLNRSYWYLAVLGTQMSGFTQAYSTFTAGSKTITLTAFGELGSGGTFWNNGVTRNSLIIMDIGAV